jgi:hypothetical protein
MLRRFPEVIRKLDQILNITPDDADVLTGKAAVAQAQGDLPRAAAILAPLRPNVDNFLTLQTSSRAWRRKQENPVAPSRH